MNDLAPTAAVPAPVTPATDRLIRDSTSANTRRAYAGALARLLAARPLDDAGIAEYLGTLDAAGKSPATEVDPIGETRIHPGVGVARPRVRPRLLRAGAPSRPDTQGTGGTGREPPCPHRPLRCVHPRRLRGDQRRAGADTGHRGYDPRPSCGRQGGDGPHQRIRPAVPANRASLRGVGPRHSGTTRGVEPRRPRSVPRGAASSGIVGRDGAARLRPRRAD